MLSRLLDIILAGIALIVLSPLLVPVAVVLRLTGEGEIFFCQSRVGRGGKTFGLYKFATMLKNSPNMGSGTVTLHRDPRILPVGHFLRKTKINELPQLINILKGDMAIIGPRPQTQRCFDAFAPHAQRAILQVRPGLSGAGSIMFRDEEAMMTGADSTRFYDEVIMAYKGDVEKWYVARKSVFLDIALIVMTIAAVLSPRFSRLDRLFRDFPPPPPALLAVIQP